MPRTYRCIVDPTAYTLTLERDGNVMLTSQRSKGATRPALRVHIVLSDEQARDLAQQLLALTKLRPEGIIEGEDYR